MHFCKLCLALQSASLLLLREANGLQIRLPGASVLGLILPGLCGQPPPVPSAFEVCLLSTHTGGRIRPWHAVSTMHDVELYSSARGTVSPLQEAFGGWRGECGNVSPFVKPEIVFAQHTLEAMGGARCVPE